jgi:hypothetical protein
MNLKPGQKLFSTVCGAQVVVVRAPADDIEIGCGGATMVEDQPEATSGAPSPDLSEGPLLGKRYADEELGLELLCARPGEGTLTVNGQPLLVKGAKPLPSSD